MWHESYILMFYNEIKYFYDHKKIDINMHSV